MKQSGAYKKFIKCHQRAMGMIRRHYELFAEHIDNREENPEWDEAHDDLFRAGIVLCTAAMDAYFTDRFCEALIPYIKKNGLNPSLNKILADAGFDTEAAISMFDNKRPKRVLSNMVRRHLSMFVTQNFKAIDKLYKALGYEKPITYLAQQRSRRKSLLKSLDKLIERRHKIVHAGDYNQHGRLNEIHYSRLVRKIIEVRKLVQCVDAELADAKI